jgi:ABC-type transport system substrate-binding protein
MFSNLALRADPFTFEIRPELISSWEVSDDGLTYTVTIQENVLLPDVPKVQAAIAAGKRASREWNAHDFAFNMLRNTGQLAATTRARFHRSGGFVGLKKGGKGLAGLPARFESTDPGVEVVDNHTVKMYLDKPNTMFITQFINIRNQMVAMGIVDDDWSADSGSADWQFNELEELVMTGGFIPNAEGYVQGSRWAFDRNDEYWKATASGSDLPFLDSVVFYDIPDSSTQLAAFIAGQLDDFYVRTIQDERTAIEKYPEATLVLFKSQCWEHLRFNVTAAPFDDPRVTKAIQMALKLDEVMSSYYEDNWYTHGPVPSDLGGGVMSTEDVIANPQYGIYDPDPADHAKNVETAKQLMTDAGYPEGEIAWHVIYYSSGARNDQVQIIQYQLAQIWPKMEVELAPASYTVWSGQQSQGDFVGGATAYVICANPDPLGDFRDNYHTNGSRNYGSHSDARLDVLLDDALYAATTDIRKAKIREAELLVINELMPTTFFGSHIRRRMVHPRIRNYATNMGPGVQWHWTHLLDQVWVEE